VGGSAATDTSPWRYLYGNTYSWDFKYEVSWFKLTGSNLQSTLPQYTYPAASGGGGGIVKAVFADQDQTCPTVLPTF
jgi:hypothetical protein